MAVSRFNHLLAGVICTVAITGAAQAGELPPGFLAEEVSPVELLAGCPPGPDRALCIKMSDYFFNRYLPASREVQENRTAIRATKPGPHEIPLCVGNCR